MLFPLLAISQKDNNACETLIKINALIQQQHYKPKPVDDSLSVYVFKTFLNQLDEDNRLFISPEIEVLKKHKYSIDNYILSGNCAFLKDFYDAYTKTISRYSSMIAALKAEPFAMKSSETVIFSRKAFPYVKEESDLKHLYRKRILFNILREVAEISSNKDSLLTNFETLSNQYKAKIFDKFDCKTESYKLSESEFNSRFYEVFCSYFDPHTEYFSESDKSTFFSTVSSDNLTFGLYVSMSEKDEMIVDDVIPGSSAYFTEKIDVGDQILKIKHNNVEFEIACASMKKIEEIITSNEYNTADFTFRKKSGEIYTVRLVKKIMKDYQNNVYSFKFKKEASTIGYIKIPSFYATFENGTSSMSDDFVKELYKLEEDSIDGLIIDIENNGGGSMSEAVKLSSLFIDSGPLAIMNNNKDKKEIIKDVNRGILYNGPLVIMINGFSASASEFFANAMQDYNRAIIIGNKSLGKASMQRIFPLSENNDEFLKLTLELFYRVTGKSNQHSGINPDVEIPLLFDKQMPREDSYETALKNDTIALNIRYRYLKNIVFGKAIALSKKRIETSKDVTDINELNNRINPLFDKDLPPITLEFSSVFNDVNKINAIWKEISILNERVYPIDIESNSADVDNQKNDDFLQSNTKERIKNIKQNYHILEAINIVYDLKK